MGGIEQGGREAVAEPCARPYGLRNSSSPDRSSAPRCQTAQEVWRWRAAVPFRAVTATPFGPSTRSIRDGAPCPACLPEEGEARDRHTEEGTRPGPAPPEGRRTALHGRTESSYKATHISDTAVERSCRDIFYRSRLPRGQLPRALAGTAAASPYRIRSRHRPPGALTRAVAGTLRIAAAEVCLTSVRRPAIPMLAPLGTESNTTGPHSYLVSAEP